MMICALPVATRVTVTVLPEAVAVALVASVVATVKSLFVAPVGAMFTVKVLVPPAVPVLVHSRQDGVIIRKALERVGVTDNLPHLVGTGDNRVSLGRHTNQ